MRKRTSPSFDLSKLSFPPDLALLGLLIVISGLVVWKLPPSSLYVIFGLFALVAGIVYLIAQRFVKKPIAALMALGIGSGLFLYALDMFDLINGVIWIGLLVSVGLFIRQK